MGRNSKEKEIPPLGQKVTSEEPATQIQNVPPTQHPKQKLNLKERPRTTPR